MPRSRSGSSGPRSRPSSPRSHSPPRGARMFQQPNHAKPKPEIQQKQAQTLQPQPGQQKKPGMFSGFGSMIAQGMGFGVGSEIGHQVVRSVTGQGSHHNQNQPAQQESSNQEIQQQEQSQQQTNKMQNPCQDYLVNFNKCLQNNSELISCQHYYDMLKECQQQHQNL